jgi:CHAT domain-containing protein/tetratricopeptide (TPR) repeat protein
MSNPFRSAIFFCLLLPGIAAAQDNAGQDAGSCQAAIDAADKLRTSEDPEKLQKSLSLYQEALRCLGPIPTHSKAKVLRKVSRVLLDLNRHDEALESLNSALAALQQLGDQNTGVLGDEANVLGNLGYDYRILGKMDQALPYFEQALHLFERLRDLDRQAFTWEQIGLVHSLRGEFQESISDYEGALHMRQKIKKRAPADLENQQQTAAIFDLQGRLYAQMNDSDKAMADYREARVLAKRTKYWLFAAYALNDIGALRLKQNQPLLAERDHWQALRELQQHKLDEKSIAETLSLLADAETAQGNYDAALKNYHDALKHQESTEDVIGQAQTHFSLGRIESATRQWPQAEESFARAAKLYGDAPSPVGESNALFRNAEALAAQSRHAEARQQVQRAIELGEKVRGYVPNSDLKASYFIRVEQMYRFEIGLLLNTKDTVPEADRLEAFTLFQRAQSRTLLDSLGTRLHASLLGGGDSEIVRGIEEHEQKIATLLRTPAEARERKDLLETVRTEEASLKQIESNAISRDPRLGVFSNVVSAEDIQKRVLDQDSALIQFYLAEPSSYAWVITQSGIDLVKLPSREILEPDVRQVLKFDLAGQWTGAQQLALNRIRRNLAPVLQAARKKRWVVVPDGALHFFPFTLLTALDDQGRGPQEIVKIPSASAIDINRRTVHPTRPAYALAIFADPVFDALDSRVAHTLRSDGGGSLSTARNSIHAHGNSLPRLRYTLTEAHALSHLFRADPPRVFREFDATLQAADNALQNFRMIHLATHSLPDEKHPELAKIVLSQVTARGVPRQGELFAHDIYQMKLSNDLVVLSSCQGAIGRQQPGEGPMSLARAFLFAGSRAVVASLWEVNDEATAELMKRFYTYMVHDKLPPSTALARAQSEFRRRPDRLHNPYYWAGFELYGEWMPQ